MPRVINPHGSLSNDLLPESNSHYQPSLTICGSLIHLIPSKSELAGPRASEVKQGSHFS
jgi:hypothetical protein